MQIIDDINRFLISFKESTYYKIPIIQVTRVITIFVFLNNMFLSEGQMLPFFFNTCLWTYVFNIPYAIHFQGSIVRKKCCMNAVVALNP